MTAHRDTINAHNAAADERRAHDHAADAAQIDIQDIKNLISYIRGGLDRGDRASVERNARYYRNLMRQLYMLQEMAERKGWTDPVFQPIAPLPFRFGLVGVSEAERRAVEWKPYN